MYKRQEYASQVMYDYKEKALSLLASLPDTEVKAALAGYLAVSYTHLDVYKRQG